MTVSISAKQRKQTVRYDLCPFVNDVVVSIKDLNEQITVNVALIFNLKAAGIKVFFVLAWMLQNRLIHTNTVILDKAVLETFLTAQEKKLALSATTFFRGISELEKAGIIAQQNHRGWYFINPDFLLNRKTVVLEKDIVFKE
ncbi:hypothetical protein D1093_09670 (plasmid) [Bartonella kosoyi]|uniref:Plasmid replication protein RepL domain-containing protein n=2 Tax=Bartonella kosoyi TaxID=2133959 RepID=A0A5B9RLX3_9HYPH|nr:hypothetical protein D1093_09670 [Bartonella kosoyi]